MSDFSVLEQSFALPAITPLADALPARPLPSRPERLRCGEVPLEEVEFRRLHAADEIDAIQKLRGEIRLPGAAQADAGFIAREKKETAREWSARSNGMTSSSAR